MTITLSDEQRSVLDHVKVEGADKWIEHAIEVLGEEQALEALELCVARHRETYRTARADQGDNYRTHKQRDIDFLKEMRDKETNPGSREGLDRLISDKENDIPPIRLRDLRRERGQP